MKRTTIMADEELLDRLREVARDERLSLAEVIRQGLELRAGQRGDRERLHKPPSFIGAVAGDGDGKTAEWSTDAPYEPRHVRALTLLPD